MYAHKHTHTLARTQTHIHTCTHTQAPAAPAGEGCHCAPRSAPPPVLCTGQQRGRPRPPAAATAAPDAVQQPARAQTCGRRKTRVTGMWMCELCVACNLFMKGRGRWRPAARLLRAWAHGHPAAHLSASARTPNFRATPCAIPIGRCAASPKRTCSCHAVLGGCGPLVCCMVCKALHASEWPTAPLILHPGTVCVCVYVGFKQQ